MNSIIIWHISPASSKAQYTGYKPSPKPDCIIGTYKSVFGILKLIQPKRLRLGRSLVCEAPSPG